jgi:hypothetical protein
MSVARELADVTRAANGLESDPSQAGKVLELLRAIPVEPGVPDARDQAVTDLVKLAVKLAEVVVASQQPK